MGCGFQERQHLILQHFTGTSAMWPMGCPGNPSPSSRAGDSRPLLYKSPGKLHSEVLAATRLDRCVCLGPESLRQGLPGGGDGGCRAAMWQSCQLAATQSMGLNSRHCRPGSQVDSVRGRGFHHLAWWEMGRPREIKWYVQGFDRVGVRILYLLDPSSFETFTKHIQQHWKMRCLLKKMGKIIPVFHSNSPMKILYNVYFIYDKLKAGDITCPRLHSYLVMN